jgi:hypothetical protein
MAETKVVNLDVNTNLGSLKSQLKEAQREVEALSAKFGATSNEAVKAAKKAAELKDAIGDAKQLTDAFNPDAKFNALSASIGGVLNGFQAFEGALGLVGVEGDAVQKTLLKVQSAMALSQGLQGLMEAKDSFKALTAVIGQTAIGQKLLSAAQVVGATVMKALNFVMKQNPIFLIIGGVTALIAAIKIFNSISEDQAEKQKRINKLNEEHRKEIEKQLQVDLKLRESKKGGLDDQERAIKLLKAKGVTDKEVYESERKLIKSQLDNIAYASGYRGFLLKEEVKKRKDLRNELNILDLEFLKSEEEKTAKQKEELDKRFVNEQKNLNDLIEQRYQASLREQEAIKNAKGFELDQANKLAEIDNAEQAKKQAKIDQEKADEEMLSEFKIGIWEKEAAEQDRIDKEKQAKKKQDIETSVNLASSGFRMIGDLTELLGKRTSKERRTAFNIKKAADLAGATIDGTKATLSAYADTPGGPVIKGFAAAIAGGFSALQIAKISQMQYSESGGGSSNSVSTPSPSGAASPQAPNFNIIGNNGLNQLTQLNQKPVQAYVVSGEMSTQQALDRNRLRNATL